MSDLRSSPTIGSSWNKAVTFISHHLRAVFIHVYFEILPESLQILRPFFEGGV
jgi:hypothetical protein